MSLAHPSQATPIQRKRFDRGPAPFTALWFIKLGRKNRSWFRMPATNDYVQACDVGRQAAADYIQYLKDNPEMAGLLLQQIAIDAGKAGSSGKAEDGSGGYVVGFFAYLEQLLVETAAGFDHYAFAQRADTRQAA